MSEQEELAAEVRAELSDWPYWVGEASHGVRMLDVSVEGAIADLTTWLRAHDDRIRAEALAPVLALADRWADEAGDDRDIESRTLRVVAAALRAAAGTPTHHTTEEDADE